MVWNSIFVLTTAERAILVFSKHERQLLQPKTSDRDEYFDCFAKADGA